MKLPRTNSGRPGERGIVIVLVAVIMLFVVGAMAALAIDVVTLYTAHSEAQLAADSAALAGARVLANSGMTSGPDATIGIAAAPIAIDVATRVASGNQVGDRRLSATGACSGPSAEICVTIDTGAANFLSNPQVVVQVQRTDLPTFFSRIWGRTALTVRATATAEAYNPSSASGTRRPVSTACVKPWLLPNIDPSSTSSGAIFTATGRINTASLLGWSNIVTGGPYLKTACSDCSTVPSTLYPWQYIPASPVDFPPPAASSVSCPGCSGFTNYQLSIAGCVQPPVSCKANVDADTSVDATRDAETAEAVNKMTHSLLNNGDSVDSLTLPSPPFQFLAGADNPLVLTGALAPNSDIMVSDSIVTVPVIDTNLTAYPDVQILGFVQLFLNPDGQASAPTQGKTQVINIVGCGTGTFGRAIVGNGSSPVTVRLVAGP